MAEITQPAMIANGRRRYDRRGVVRAILARFVAGESLRDICAEPGMPAPRVVEEWAKRNRELSELYTRALESRDGA